MKDLRIIFMGTPEFAVPSLEKLVATSWNVVAVITAPDKPQGRGQKTSMSPVKACALRHRIPVLQPTNLKSPDFIKELQGFQANLQVVVAFRMLPEMVWAMPALGTFNLHGSLLPQYRGAAPIQWAVINGEKETGVTTFFLQHDIDTGKIIFQEKEPIHEDDDAGQIYERLMHKGATLVEKTVAAIASGVYPSQEQSLDQPLKHAPKIFRETCEINWDQTTEQIRNFIRGLSPYPAAWTVLQGKTYKIFKVHRSNAILPLSQPWQTDNKTYLYFRTSDGCLSVDEIQAEGKRKMTIKEFFLGNKL